MRPVDFAEGGDSPDFIMVCVMQELLIHSSLRSGIAVWAKGSTDSMLLS